MKSGRQRRTEILAKRLAAAEKKRLPQPDPRFPDAPFENAGTAPCNPQLLAPNNSYGLEFTLRGYYVDMGFTCRDCSKQELWTATQQKWWYEVAKGNVESTATRCRACRRKERERAAEARRASEEGKAAKPMRSTAPIRTVEEKRLNRSQARQRT